VLVQHEQQMLCYPVNYETMETMTEFAMLTGLGFFTLTRKRYQMTMPAQEVDVDAVRAAASKVSETDDEDLMIHQSVSSAPCVVPTRRNGFAA
jgi:hypothetical protein